MSTNPVRVPFVGLARQYQSIKADLHSALEEVGQSGTYIMGKSVEDFELACANFLGVKHVISVGNGSDALFFILKALGVGPGCEVITVANSFIATAWTIVAAGATPVFADVRHDLNINPAEITRNITPKTKAIMPVHLTGRPADMDLIMTIAEKHRLFVIEDAAQAFGAAYNGRNVGTFGNAAGFSLHPLKNLGLYGDGGFVSTNNDEIAQKVRLLRNHGLRNRDECLFWGYNSRLDELQAKFGMIKLDYLNAWNKRSRDIAKFYQERLRSVVEVPQDAPGEFSIYHNFVIRSPERDSLAHYLGSSGIETRIHYPIPIHRQIAYIEKFGEEVHLPNTELFSKTILSLPIFPEMEDQELSAVTDAVLRYFQK